MSSFKDLLMALDTRAALAGPTGEYTSGAGLAAHTLMRVLVDPDTPAPAKIAAAKEIADRCEGKSRQAAEERQDTTAVTLDDVELANLTHEESREFARLLRLAGVERLLGE
jgi:hypothetical protein